MAQLTAFTQAWTHPSDAPTRQSWQALVALCIGFFMILLDQTAVAVATPSFQTEFNADYASVLWVTSAYLLAVAVPLLVMGRLGDQLGPKRVYIVGMLIFVLASIWCGLAGSISSLIAARIVQGFGAGMLSPQTMAVITRMFSPLRRGQAMGAWGAVAGIATLAGPVLGGILTAQFGWRSIFFINVPIGVLSVVLVALWVPRFATHRHAYDIGGMILSSLGMLGLTFGILEAERLGLSSWLVGCIGIGAVLLIAFAWTQQQREAKGLAVIVPPRLFGDANFRIGTLTIATMGFISAGTMVPMMLFLQEGRGLDAQQAGFMMAPMAVLSAASAPFVGRATERIEPRVLSLCGFGLLGVAYVVMCAVMVAGFPLWTFGILVALIGLGNSLVWSPNSMATTRNLPPADAGAGSGVYNSARQVGAVVGSAVLGLVIQVALLHTDVPAAMGWSMAAAAVVMVCGFFVAARFRPVLSADPKAV